MFESTCFHREALTVALAVASVQRALHGTKNVENEIRQLSATRIKNAFASLGISSFFCEEVDQMVRNKWYSSYLFNSFFHHTFFFPRLSLKILLASDSNSAKTAVES